uniref:AlNc14C27G2630 protein n=1 Tax=Albugo laibachii Nc14 TaxID=890382 RepID=F0W6Z7_9STRA|nr:AlNc14C27G2630 [Albugo laibachii Nc14]|eukprot:CCA16892.1 AlNc14C27G2630 [Albugo laibachii Nc14]
MAIGIETRGNFQKCKNVWIQKKIELLSGVKRIQKQYCRISRFTRGVEVAYPLASTMFAV